MELPLWHVDNFDEVMRGSLHFSTTWREGRQRTEALGHIAEPTPPPPPNQAVWIGPLDGWACPDPDCAHLVNPISDDPERDEMCPSCGCVIFPVHGGILRENVQLLKQRLQTEIDVNQRLLDSLV